MVPSIRNGTRLPCSTRLRDKGLWTNEKTYEIKTRGTKSSGVKIRAAKVRGVKTRYVEMILKG